MEIERKFLPIFKNRLDIQVNVSVAVYYRVPVLSLFLLMSFSVTFKAALFGFWAFDDHSLNSKVGVVICLYSVHRLIRIKYSGRIYLRFDPYNYRTGIGITGTSWTAVHEYALHVFVAAP